MRARDDTTAHLPPLAARGRPLVCDGAPVVAARSEGPAWTDDLSPEVNSLDAATREALADAWIDDALAEHASIGAFTRVSMQLLAAAAPPELIEGAHRAAMDEVRHAKLCFTLASMYARRWESAGALAVDAIRKARCDKASIAREALLEGCLGEGVAAALARAGCESAQDAEVRRVLEVIAADEQRHAHLAWQILEWCMADGEPTVADAVVEALRVMSMADFAVEAPARVAPDVWVACGRVEAQHAARLHRAVSTQVADRAWRLPTLSGRMQAVTPRRAAPRSRKG